jgi:hypothetical protein
MTMRVAFSHIHTVADSDGAAILDVDHGSISTLNSTGAFVWQGLQCGETVSAIVTQLARETGEAPATVERDVLDFVENLTKQHLLP